MKSFYILILPFLFIISPSQATHILGGEITASHISANTYKIVVSLYLDIDKGSPAAESAQSMPVCFGDGYTADAARVSTSVAEKGVALAKYEVTYTYPASGIFQISTSVNTRNPDYLNLPSDGTDKFFLWTVIDTQFSNNTPILAPTPMTAGVRQVFTADLTPSVQDKDSISVRLQAVSTPSPGTCGVRSLQKSFFYPNDVTKAGTFKVDNKLKKLIWTAPEQVGRYVYAFVIDEWRNGITVSQSYYERTVVVTDRPGETVTVPEYEPAGALITAVVNPGGSPEARMAINAFPVPATDFITFKVTSQKRSVITVRLVDLKGTVVREMSSQTPEVEFEDRMDVRQLSSGLYVLQSSNGSETVSKKIVR